MITAKIVVEYVPGTGTSVESFDPGGDISNVSNSSEIFNDTEYVGYKGFHLAEELGKYPSTCNGEYLYYPDEGYKGYCSSKLSDTDCYIGIDFNLQLSNCPETIAIYFDSISNTYARTVQVLNSENSNSIIVNNRSSVCLIDITALNIKKSDTIIYIKFQYLNRPNTNLKITKMAFEYIRTYTDDIIKDFKCSEQLLDTTFRINPGVLQQYAEISFKDKYGEFKDLAKRELLNDNLFVKIYINDTLVGTYMTESWDIKANNTNVSLNCTDPCRLLDYINVTRVPVASRTVDDLLNMAFSYTEYTFEYLDSDVEELCKKITNGTSWIYPSSLTDFLKKVCLLGMIRIYWYKDKFMVARCY